MRPLTKLVTAYLAALGLLAALATPAVAQDAAGAGTQAGQRRPIELNFGGAGVLSWLTSGGDLRALVTIPLSDRVSLELFGGPYYGGIGRTFVLETGEDILAFYGAQVTRRIDRGRRPGVEPFLSFGAEGVVSRELWLLPCHPPGCSSRPSRTHVIPPIVGMFGFGVQKTLSPRLAMRIEVQGLIALVVPAGVRAGISLSIPLGRVYETRAR